MDIDKILTNYAQAEQEVVTQRIKQAIIRKESGATVRQILHVMFDLEDNPPDQAQIFGDARSTLACATTRTIVPIWPVRNPEPHELSGIPINDLRQYIEDGVVVPLIQEPWRYADCPAIVELIRDYQPASSFWRGNLVYSILSGGDEHYEKVESTLLSGPAIDWFKYGMEHEVLKKAPQHRSTWEPQHQRNIANPLDKWGRDYLRSSFAFKYVNACTFLSPDWVNQLLKGLPVKSALSFLTTFHMITDHPISHALLTNAAVDFTSTDWRVFTRDKSDYFANSELTSDLAIIPLAIPTNPTYKDYIAMRDAGLGLPIGIISELRSLDIDQLIAYRNRLTQAALEYEEFCGRHLKHANTVQRLVRISALVFAGVGSATGFLSDREALVQLLLSILAEESIAEYVVNRLEKADIDHLITKMFKANDKPASL